MANHNSIPCVSLGLEHCTDTEGRVICWRHVVIDLGVYSVAWQQICTVLSFPVTDLSLNAVGSWY